MKIKKELKKLVNRAVKESFDKGNPLNQKIESFTKAFKSLDRPQAISTLSLYVKGLKREIEKTTLTVESPIKLTTAEIKKIAQAFPSSFNILSSTFKLNSSLLGGLRLKIGDTIVEDTINSRIDEVKGVIING